MFKGSVVTNTAANNSAVAIGDKASNIRVLAFIGFIMTSSYVVRQIKKPERQIVVLQVTTSATKK